MDAKEGAELSRIAYLPQYERSDAAGRLGYSIDSQDEDRVLFSKDGQGVLAFRGTDLKRPKNAWRPDDATSHLTVITFLSRLTHAAAVRRSSSAHHSQD